MKKVCFVTGTRAEYGLLRNLIHLVNNDIGFELQTIVTGAHLSEKYGKTKTEIIEDGIEIDAEVDILKFGNDKLSIAKSMGLAISGIAEALNLLNSDLVVLLGDRYECLAAAQAALVLGIPIAHIHGGEVTEGAIDDAFRHSITKMSNLHFVSNDVHRERVIQLGESESRVFNLGAPGLDNTKQVKLKTKEALSNELGFELRDNVFIVTYHPVTNSNYNEKVDPLLRALELFPDTSIIITMPNADAESDLIKNTINEWADGKSNVYVTESLGFVNYLSMLKIGNVVIGNSSSGIIEAPMMKLPTVNIGVRQKGRERSNSIFDTSCEKELIYNAIKSAVDFKKTRNEDEYKSVYGDGETSEEILKTLKNLDLNKVKSKTFIDLKR